MYGRLRKKRKTTQSSKPRKFYRSQKGRRIPRLRHLQILPSQKTKSKLMIKNIRQRQRQRRIPKSEASAVPTEPKDKVDVQPKDKGKENRVT